jgi:hypothetical protein
MGIKIVSKTRKNAYIVRNATNKLNQASYGTTIAKNIYDCVSCETKEKDHLVMQIGTIEKF